MFYNLIIILYYLRWIFFILIHLYIIIHDRAVSLAFLNHGFANADSLRQNSDSKHSIFAWALCASAVCLMIQWRSSFISWAWLSGRTLSAETASKSHTAPQVRVARIYMGPSPLVMLYLSIFILLTVFHISIDSCTYNFLIICLLYECEITWNHMQEWTAQKHSEKQSLNHYE